MDALSALGRAAAPRPTAAKGAGGLSKTPEDQAALQKLQARDREVRAHEQAHLSAAGDIARGGPTYTYQRGPDGRMYAIGGEVSLDTSPVPDDPQATLAKARQIQAAATAPADPSPQDRAIAAAAAQMAAAASLELARKQARGTEPGGIDLEA
ncbi:MAG TPA: putative metalloprotease CJM1_0395 family protein [Holophagaceae bacterium]|nr:putative metalloprotease CJM1_0395 family protein [Holophagaceae bacterium]